MRKKDLITYRPGRLSDYTFIEATWIPGLYWGNSWFGTIPIRLYEKNYRPIVEKLMQKSEVRMACLKEDLDVLLGYSVYSDITLHWIYVKEHWRGPECGIAKDLLPGTISQVSHLTKAGREILKTHKELDHIIFNPFSI